MRLKDKIALVTGGTAGIGAATAELFVEEGAQVVVCGRNVDRGTAFVAELAARGHTIDYRRADCSVDADVASLAEYIRVTYGALHAVFANAGFEHVHGVRECDGAEWRHILENDLTGVYLTVHYTFPLMIDSGGGSYILMSSIVGTTSGGWSVAFCSAQAGKEMLARHIAVEGAPFKIRGNAVAPGSTRTASLMRFYEGYSGGIGPGTKWSSDHHPIGRLLESREIAYGVLFLASDDASYVTGQTLRVDGGYVAR